MRLRLAAGVLCLAVAGLCALAARDVWAVRKAMRDGDARVEVRHIDPTAWSARTRLPFGAARRLLGVEDDLDLRALLTRASDASSGRRTADGALRQIPVEVALMRIARERDYASASLATNLLGVLLLRRPNEPGLPSPEKRALEEFRQAARLDPDNDAAKANLEVLLRREQDAKRRGRRTPTGGDLPGDSGVGLAQPGRGY